MVQRVLTSVTVPVSNPAKVLTRVNGVDVLVDLVRSVGGGGGPTAVFYEAEQRTENVKINKLQFSEQVNKSDRVSIPFKLNDLQQRGDGYKLPFASMTIIENLQHSDRIGSSSVNLQETQRRTDSVTVRIDWLTAGKFTFTAPVTGNYLLQNWAGGGSGGGGLVGAGGGAAGGAFASVLLARNAGQTLTVRVGATVAGGAAATAGTVGADAWISNTGVAPTSTAQGALAKGGAPGAAGSTGSGAGGAGSTTGCIGTVTRAGGNGTAGGAGGGGAGDSFAGAGQIGGNAGGGNGGPAGQPGVQAGGGGGGGGAAAAGGAGALGRASISFTV